MDIRWRLLISCLKCEYDNYQPLYLEESTTHYLDDEAGRASYELEDGQLRTEDLIKVSYYFKHENPIEIKYNSLLVDFQTDLAQLFPLLRGDESLLNSDADMLDDGEDYIEMSRNYPDVPAAFEITPASALSLIELLDQLDLSSDFWIAAGNAMRDTLNRHHCEHDWVDDDCTTCGAPRFFLEQ